MPYRHTGIRSLRSAAALLSVCVWSAAIQSRRRRRRSFNVHSALKSIEVAAAAAVANSEVRGRAYGVHTTAVPLYDCEIIVDSQSVSECVRYVRTYERRLLRARERARRRKKKKAKR